VVVALKVPAVAMPPVIVTVVVLLAPNKPDAAVFGAVKVTVSPSTTPPSKLTVTPKRFPNNVLTVVLCGVVPFMGVRVNPLDSNAPISRVPLTVRIPRWSDVVGIAPPAVVLASRAILLGERANVCVEPPLLARVVLITVLAAPVGVMGVTPVVVPLIPLVAFSPTMFAPEKLIVPPVLLISGFPTDELPTMMLLEILVVPFSLKIAPCGLGVLPKTVILDMLVVPEKLKIIPLPLVVELPEKVLRTYARSIGIEGHLSWDLK